MTRFLLLLLLTATMVGCEEKPVLPADPPIVGEVILVLGPKNSLLLEVQEEGELLVAWSEGQANCEATEAITRQWAYLRAVTSRGPSETGTDVSLDPNQAIDGVTLGFSHRLDNGQHLTKYPPQDTEISGLVNALEAIFLGCSLTLEFSYFSPPY